MVVLLLFQLFTLGFFLAASSSIGGLPEFVRWLIGADRSTVDAEGPAAAAAADSVLWGRSAGLSLCFVGLSSRRRNGMENVDIVFFFFFLCGFFWSPFVGVLDDDDWMLCLEREREDGVIFLDSFLLVSIGCV